MRDRPYIQRGLCRRALRRHRSVASREQQELIRTALADRAIFETVYEQAMNKAEEYSSHTGEFTVSRSDEGMLIVDNLLKLLTWFLENGPELIRIIELIIGLFGGLEAISMSGEDAAGDGGGS